MANEAFESIKMDHSQASNTMFVFVPGAWHPTDYLEPMRNYLSERGYNSIAISHQTLDPINPGTSVFDDAAKLEKVVKELLDAGKNIILVMREYNNNDSYGGSVGSQAIGHLLSKFRSTPSHGEENISKIGKIVRLVYVAALVPLAGETTAALSEVIAADNANEFSLPLEIVDGRMFCKQEIKELFYGDLPESERDKYYKLLQGWPATGRPDIPTHFGWQYVPSTYICATNDRVVSAKAQARMWSRANATVSNLEASQSLLKQWTNSRLGEKPCATTGSGDSVVVGKPLSSGPGYMTVKEIDSDHCSMFILRKHVEVLGSILIEMVEP
ncbi:hypothetical protein N0V93_005903 [Gnomoniopsis smithogilvyi]|uniref:AB hydrolase-1 domain-containing protein n=1 Tax=Gnomoniopsis smithogilvyi TaxID=1191159 RepID=A0A9W8YVA9_9PEZI|nr:hypothetical protein N0V93_005903 [Gnomoniopsis smithogilvyi]